MQYVFYFLFPKMRNIVVLHFGQLPFNAFLVTPPFPFIVTSFALEISRLSLHFTQYPFSPMVINPPFYVHLLSFYIRLL